MPCVRVCPVRGGGGAYGAPMAKYGVTLIVGALAVGLAGCGSSGAGEQPSASASPTPSASQAEAYEQVPAKNRAAFLKVLGRADPGLIDGANQRERGLRRAVYTCRDIENDGLRGTKLAIRISQRFTGGHGDVSIAEGRVLGKAIVKYVCPALG